MTAYRKERIKHALSYMVLFVMVIAFIVMSIVLFMIKPNYTYKQAIYKGYLKQGSRYTYPIVEVDGKEIKATNSQVVRDDSYIGNTVTIYYINNDINGFIVQW